MVPAAQKRDRGGGRKWAARVDKETGRNIYTSRSPESNRKIQRKFMQSMCQTEQEALVTPCLSRILHSMVRFLSRVTAPITAPWIGTVRNQVRNKGRKMQEKGFLSRDGHDLSCVSLYEDHMAPQVPWILSPYFPDGCPNHKPLCTAQITLHF